MVHLYIHKGFYLGRGRVVLKTHQQNEGLHQSPIFMETASAHGLQPEVALRLRKSLKPFPQGDLENLNWGAVLTLLGLGLALSQAPDLAAVLQSNVLRFFA